MINTRRGDLDHLSAEQLYKNYRLCSKHFELSQFMEPTKKNKLVWNAVPTLFNVPHPPKKVTSARQPVKKRARLDEDPGSRLIPTIGKYKFSLVRCHIYHYFW